MAAKRIANGSAADLFGWTGELLRHLVQDKKTLPLMAEIIKAIRDGKVPDDAREWLLASWLIPLDKGEGKIRPIAGGSALVKLAAAYLMENVSERVKDTFRLSGTQYGLFMRDGTTAAAHITQLNLDRNPSHIAIKIDFANAFNTIPRKHILGQLYKHPELSAMYPLVHWAYSKPSHLMVHDDKGDLAALLQSKEGVRQGCVLGSLAFAVATLEMFTQLKKSHKDIELVAYLDDVNISGPPESALRTFGELQEEAQRFGLVVQQNKCEVLIPGLDEAPDELLRKIERYGLRTQKGALPLLGTVVGHDPNKIQTLVEEKVEGWKKAVELLASEEIPTQLALLVGRWMMTAKPNALARSLPPTLTIPPLKDFGNTVLNVMQRRLNLKLEGDAKILFQQPLKEGGVGFCSPSETAPYVFIAGVASSCLAIRQTNLNEEKGSVGGGWLLEQLSQCLSRITPEAGWPDDEALIHGVGPFFEHYSNVGKRKRSEHLQAKLVGHFRAGRRKHIKEHFISKESIARMESRANKGSALLWKTYPLTQEFALSDEEMRFSVAYATGQPLPHMPELCGCASRAQLTIEHTVNCAEKLTRHNMLQSRLVSFARLHGVTTRQNPRLNYQDAKEKLEPDVIFYPGIHEPVQTDITVVNSCAPSILKRSRLAHLYATNERRAKKRLKYLHNATARGELFRPLIFETHGKISEEVDVTLDMLASRTPMDQGLAKTDMKLDLAVTLARGNALAARTTIAWAQRARDRGRAVHPAPG